MTAEDAITYWKLQSDVGVDALNAIRKIVMGATIEMKENANNFSESLEEALEKAEGKK